MAGDTRGSARAGLLPAAAVGAGLLVLASLFFAALQALRGSPGLRPGAPAPDFTLPGVGGGECRLSDHLGKVVVVSFWATWCGPCAQEMPHLQRLHRDLGPRGATVLTLSVDDDPAAVRRFLGDHRLDLPACIADAAVQSRWRVGSIPSLYVVGRDGKIAAHSVGYAPGDEAALRDSVERLLSP